MSNRKKWAIGSLIGVFLLAGVITSRMIMLPQKNMTPVDTLPESRSNPTGPDTSSFHRKSDIEKTVPNATGKLPSEEPAIIEEKVPVQATGLLYAPVIKGRKTDNNTVSISENALKMTLNKKLLNNGWIGVFGVGGGGYGQFGWRGGGSQSYGIGGSPYNPYSSCDTEQYAIVYDNRMLRPVTHPYSTFSIDVDSASYSNIRRFIRNNRLPPEHAVRIEEMINYFSYDYPAPRGPHPFSVTAELSECPWNYTHLLAHIGIKGREISDNTSMPPSNLVFLIDVSGSMRSPDKLPLLKGCFRLLIEKLRAIDEVAIITYRSHASQVLKPTSGLYKDRILGAVNSLNAHGSTAGAQGLKLAYKTALSNFMVNGNNRVILATDGDFNVGITDDNELKKLIENKRELGVFLSILGFGTGNLKDAKLEKIADNGNGNYAYIDSRRKSAWS